MNISDIPEDQKPKIEFPCQYPIKVMGTATVDFKDYVIETMAKYADIEANSVKVKASGKGNFQSVTITITATGAPQLKAIYADLKSSGRVKMVL